MSALTDLLVERTTLSDDEVSHLQRLVGEWQLLSDLSFADLLLWVPLGDGSLLCAAQCRPTTGPTAYVNDQVGVVVTGDRASSLNIALTEARIFRDTDPDWDGDLPVRRESIPIQRRQRMIGVLGRDSNLANIRSPSQLELVYLQSAADLSYMISEGTFPGREADTEEVSGPRVGDGMVRVERDGTILYASPNAVSAFRRLGVTGPVVGEPVDTLTSIVADDPFDASDLANSVHDAVGGGNPRSIEVDGGGATILFRALPLRPRGEPLGALVLMQDVTELRRRDRALMSKDATIREIHHRVKNNLQTVAALLRMQARRVSAPEARLALEESMRRVSSIALVHETLSVSMDEVVDFDDVVDRLTRMLSDLTGSTALVSITRSGSFGELPAEIATALVLVLTELVQNAVEHGFADGRAGSVLVDAQRSRGQLTVRIADDGAGLPTGFDMQSSDRLGLQIVRTLIGTDLSGTIELHARTDIRQGAEAVMTVPIRRTTPTAAS